jgi:hypothetical protein
MDTKLCRSSLGDHWTGSSPAAATTRRNDRRTFAASKAVPRAVVNTKPVSCHLSPVCSLCRSWSAWSRRPAERAAGARSGTDRHCACGYVATDPAAHTSTGRGSRAGFYRCTKAARAARSRTRRRACLRRRIKRQRDGGTTPVTIDLGRADPEPALLVKVVRQVWRSTLTSRAEPGTTGCRSTAAGWPNGVTCMRGVSRFP